MDFPAYTHHYLLSPEPFFSFNFVAKNYVHWSQTPESHLYSVHLPGVRKEEIRVDLEDYRFLIIRTEQTEGSAAQPPKSFYRKFRLPDRIELGGISASYEDGVLTVTVPRTNVRRRGRFRHMETAIQSLQSLQTQRMQRLQEIAAAIGPGR